jgi:hypothetical protein
MERLTNIKATKSTHLSGKSIRQAIFFFVGDIRVVCLRAVSQSHHCGCNGVF